MAADVGVPGRAGGRPRAVRLLIAVATLIAGVGVGVAIGGAVARHPAATASRAQYLPAQGREVVPAPDFSLHDQNGQPVSLSSFRGQPVLVTFMDPRCTSMCPILGQELAAVEQRLPAAATPALLIVSVAPGRTAGDVRHFATGVAWRPGWHWLLGVQTELAPVWAAYHIAVQPVPDDVKHDQILYVIDAQGRISSGYAAPLPIDEVTAAIQGSVPR